MISAWWLLLIVPCACSVGFLAGAAWAASDIFGG